MPTQTELEFYKALNFGQLYATTYTYTEDITNSHGSWDTHECKFNAAAFASQFLEFDVDDWNKYIQANGVETKGIGKLLLIPSCGLIGKVYMKYPEITDRQLLELICVRLQYLGDNFASLELEDLKKEILEDLAQEVSIRLECSNYYSSDLYNDIRKIMGVE